jgi:hypothetical protein
LAFSPDGGWLAVAGGDGAVHVWDMATGRDVHTLAGHIGPVTAVAFSSDGRRLVSVSTDRTLKFWDPVVGQEVASLRRHEEAVCSVAFHPDGMRLATADKDGTIRLWEAEPPSPASAPPASADPLPLPDPDSLRAAQRKRKVQRDLVQLGLAMHNYADGNRSQLPPAAVTAKDGQPLLSWRVLLLPVLDQEELFRQFRLDEPWDSEHNKKLLPRIPAVYALPPGEADRGPLTAYRAFVGDEAAFPARGSARFPASFTDGTSFTILVAEAADAVPWTKPDELSVAADRPLPRLGGRLRGWFGVGMADGTVRLVRDDVDERLLRRAIHPRDGQALPDDWHLRSR